MEEILLGTRIKNRRKELKVSQEDLCEGLCAISTLSRIENNEQVPSRNLAKNILERLGMSDDLLYMVVSQKETAVWALIREIRNDMVDCRKMIVAERPQAQKRILKKLAELEKIVSPQDYTARQFLLATKALLGSSEGPYSTEDKLAMQLEAIRLTHARFDPEDFRHGHYTMDEVRLISQIANTYSGLGNRTRAIDMFSQLLSYMEKNSQQWTGYAGQFCLIIQNYAINLVYEESYRKAIEISEKGRITSIYYGSRQFLPGFVAIQAECCALLGEKERSKELYLQAYYTYKTFEDESNLQNMRREMKKYLNIEMPG